MCRLSSACRPLSLCVAADGVVLIAATSSETGGQRTGDSAGQPVAFFIAAPRTGALFDARPAAVCPHDGCPGTSDGVRQRRRCLRRVILGAVVYGEILNHGGGHVAPDIIGLARAERPTAAAKTAPGGVPAPAPVPWRRHHGGHCRRIR